MCAHLAPLATIIDATDATSQRTRARYIVLHSCRKANAFALHGVDCSATVAWLHHFARILFMEHQSARVTDGEHARDAVQRTSTKSSVRSLSVFGKKSPMGGSRSRTAVPETFAIVDGRWRRTPLQRARGCP